MNTGTRRVQDDLARRLQTDARTSPAPEDAITTPRTGSTTPTEALHSPPQQGRRIIIDVTDDLDADLIVNMAERLKSARVVSSGNPTEAHA